MLFDVVSVVVFKSISPSGPLSVQVLRHRWHFLSAQMRHTLPNDAVVVPGADFRCICSNVSFHHKDAGQLKTRNLCYSAKPNDCWLLCRILQCGGLNFLWKVEGLASRWWTDRSDATGIDWHERRRREAVWLIHGGQVTKIKETWRTRQGRKTSAALLSEEIHTQMLSDNALS